MKINTLSHQTINNPIYLKLVASTQVENLNNGQPTEECDIFVIDGASCSPEEVSQAIGPMEAGISVLLLDPTEEHKQALGRKTGFRSHGAGRGYLVVRKTTQNGHFRYHIVEAKDTAMTVELGCQSGEGDSNGVTKTLPAEVHESVQEHLLSDDEVDVFLAAMESLQNTEMTEAEDPPSGLEWTQWVYSRTQTFNAMGSQNPDNELGPPPTQTITLLLTYNFDAALNNAPQSGPYQYLGLLATGIFQNNGLNGNTDTNYGWTLASASPSFEVTSDLSWYSSSPANTNNETQVTTDSSVNIGFDSNGVSGSYNYSNSVTQNIADWYINQQTATEWLYAQNTPYNGAVTSDIPDCINWYSGHINTSSFPAISNSSLQFAVNAVWKTNSVLDSEVTVTVNTPLQVNYIMVKETLGIGTAYAYWYSRSPSGYAEPFSIDLGAVSGATSEDAVKAETLA